MEHSITPPVPLRCHLCVAIVTNFFLLYFSLKIFRFHSFFISFYSLWSFALLLRADCPFLCELIIEIA